MHKFNMQSGQARGTYPAVRSNNAKWNAVEVARLRKKARKEAAERNGGGARGNIMGAAAFAAEEEAKDEELRKQLRRLKPGAHSGPLSSVATDATNERMLSTGLDGVLAVWDFRSHRLLHAVHLGSPVAQAILQRESGLLAAACDDFVVRLYDANINDAGTAVSAVRTGKRKKTPPPPRRVRTFAGHTGRVTDMAMTPDGRWLLTASTDGTVRVWDVPTAACVDWFRFDETVTSLDLSPSGEFLATTHVDNNGIFLWANRAHFGNVVLGDGGVEGKPRKMSLPVPQVQVRRSDKDEVLRGGGASAQLEDAEAAPTSSSSSKKSTLKLPSDKPLAPGLTTLSGLSRAKWANLPDIEIIKARNKPTEPAKAPEKAPFFLGQLSGLDAKTGRPSLFEQSVVAEEAIAGGGTLENEAEGVAGEDGKGAATRLLRMGGRGAEMSLVGLLNLSSSSSMDQSLVSSGESRIGSGSGDLPEHWSKVMEYLKGLSASGVDVQLSSLCMGTEDVEGKASLSEMMRCLTAALGSNADFDVIQAYTNRFVTLHADTIIADEQLVEVAKELRDAQRKAWGKVQTLLQHTNCLLKLFTRAN